MTIIEKIKAEIERLKKAQEVSEDKDYAQYELDVACGYDMACDDILSFLSTLESEHLADASKTLPNELEEAAGDYERTVNYGGDIYSNVAIRKAFIAGAKWDKEQMMSNAVEGWVAVDSDIYGKRRVTFFPQKPVRDVLTEYKYWAATRPRHESIKLDSNAFLSLKWEDEPKKVKLIIVKED